MCLRLEQAAGSELAIAKLSSEPAGDSGMAEAVPGSDAGDSTTAEDLADSLNMRGV